MNIGEILVALRKERGVYQKQLAKHLGVSVGTISNYENGIHFPDLENLSKLADYFNVTTDFLLGRTSYRSGLETLNHLVVPDYTIADFINSILELAPDNVNRLHDYLNLLTFRNDQAAKPVKKRKKKKSENT
ncbi:MAG: helix-turn-helix domain-containing protein [Clostridium sp.]|jgi:transcriptional regulator with XRE-family HTH domain|nr:helix-turn-helix domain-containing protein [Clostridium sp.]